MSRRAFFMIHRVLPLMTGERDALPEGGHVATIDDIKTIDAP
ncbi:hypothetical protein AWB78_06887 [Caballeronia calidae]|uniref:Uncharacterized protein n=1 Tax=Caballeronia calidae TaxID=1777139 RepID=A0A158EBM9_9BURK|nr:hypothetical protein AWB78_06887 [Caballeronia calidae]